MGILAALLGATAGITSAIVCESIPVGIAIAAGTTAIGVAVGEELSSESCGCSKEAGDLAAGFVTASLNGLVLACGACGVFESTDK